ncbi:unnamed protein product [Acanthoscelides obtectus]|uniref:ZAD domain-containing protein n=1 Tax=Acanthoscelides obtectus TaxID=200917 RepID=A0A9P0KJM5_ACAOB|nr:unnamed protein product [Acanthoscelides obtectus]CAK1665135.1 hypothetical protein AOBTE_LOCUS24675 [Acanthoscelides obtectus]
MDACNLCLQNTYQLVDSEVSRRLSACIKFSNYLPNIPHQKHMFACELCLQNFSTFIEFHDMVVATESKIEFVLKELSCQKVNLKSICDGANMLDKRQHCRVCLNPVKWLGIYLYKNDTNILDFSILKKMFTYCNLNLDFEVSDRPVLCRQCFERLQITYNFKKTITEAFEGSIESIEDGFEEPTVSDPEVRVRNDLMYQLEEHNYSSRQISAESDPKLKCNAVVVLERLPDIVPNPVYQRRRRRRKGQKSQSRSYLNRNCKLKSNHETENNSTREESRLTLSANSQTSNHRGELENDQLGHGRVYNNEDLILLQLYYTHTKLETDFPTGYWENIAFDWRSITRKIKGQLQLSRKV